MTTEARFATLAPLMEYRIASCEKQLDGLRKHGHDVNGNIIKLNEELSVISKAIDINYDTVKTILHRVENLEIDSRTKDVAMTTEQRVKTEFFKKLPFYLYHSAVFFCIAAFVAKSINPVKLLEFLSIVPH